MPSNFQHQDIEVNAIDKNDDTPLHLLVCNDVDPWTLKQRIPLIRMLLDHPSIDIVQKNKENATPIDLIEKRIAELEDVDHENTLPLWLEIKPLFGDDFPPKRKRRKYDYFLDNFVKW